MEGKHGSCKVTDIFNKMDKPEQDAFRKLLKSDVSSETIVRVLKKHGFLISPSTLKRHRRRDCDCGEL